MNCEVSFNEQYQMNTQFNDISFNYDNDNKLINDNKLDLSFQSERSSETDNSFSIINIDDNDDDETTMSNNNNNESFTRNINLHQTTITTKTNLQFVIAFTLTKLIQNTKEENALSSSSTQNECSFYCENIPNISLYDYLSRIVQYTDIQESTLIIALIYIDRYANAYNNISYHIIHKLLFAAIVLAIKYNEDEIYKNDYYANIAGVDIKELNAMESELLFKLNFELYVDNDVFMDELGRKPDAKERKLIETKYQMLTDEQANQIASFYHLVQDKVDCFICQCEYGQSRSAAIAAAIMEYRSRKGISVFSDDRYYPNKMVFKKVFFALNQLCSN
jgi:hypothetical protein